MQFIDGQEYTKDCRHFDYTGVLCCPTCHENPDHEMEIVIVDGEVCLLCCMLKVFFYPEKSRDRMTPEEKLLRAIFGEGPHEQIDQQMD